MTDERICVIKGPTTDKLTKDNAIVFAGQCAMLRKIKFDATMSANMNGLFISLPSRRSRYTSRSNTHVLAKELKDTKLPENCTDLRVILVCEYSHSLALVSSVARTYPLYHRQKDFVPMNVVIEVVCMDKDLTGADVSMLTDLAASIRTTARLADTPANELTTDKYVEEAVAIGKKLGCTSLVIKGEELLKKGFGGIYHVGKAGPTPPAFVVLSHEPSGAKDTFALVGKGIVYDCGGMHIKTSNHMLGMKRDMAGSAALLGAFAALVKAKFSESLHLCLCIAENNISPAANKPDDVITLLSGRTVEITNTDAEGRLVLADGVFYARSVLKAKHIINMATLTGSQAYMTGKTHAAVMCSQEESEEKIVSAGLLSGDLVHPMIYAPDMHAIDLYSPVADMNNANWGDVQN
ncbi:hypothetical protein PRIPAC_70984 [Pristionchus pacificus]|uniref:Peptidase n=1 Tax=Pristionchus pacificus TaxID=54126 RepID=A0A2A6C706_PRIPA|nr:hypothetical protein PRIPAC_70984 [Pristionchus pacificus]|eukprot:PDM73949.1 Peptidase [Pristionchus pacificus]